MKKNTIFILIFISVTNVNIFSQSVDSSKLRIFDWSGYLKQMQTVIYQPTLNTTLLDGLFQHRQNVTFLPENHVFRIRAGLRSRLFYGNFFELNPNQTETIHELNNNYLNLSFNLIEDDKVLLNSYFDRLFAEFTFKAVEIRIGRQRINWGINTFWNPNDLFNAYDFTDFDYEERPGADAVRAIWYTGPVSRLEGAIQIAGHWKDVTGALLYRWNLGNFDYQILAGKYAEDISAGGGWSGYIGDIGWKGEFSFFFSGTQNAFNLSSGLDYSFDDGLFLNAGYLYNELGTVQSDPTGLFNFQLSAKKLYPYRHAVFVSTNYPFSPIFVGGLSAVYSPVELHPFFISPNLSYGLAQNWDLDFFSQIFLTGASGSGSAGTDVFAFFLRLRLSM